MPTGAFSLTFDQVINRAMHIVGKTQHTLTPEASELADAREILNLIIHEQENEEVFSQQVEEVITRFVASSAVTGTDGKIYRCVVSHVATVDNRPVSGGQWPMFWVVDASKTPTTWTLGTSYVSSGDYAAPDDTQGIWSAKIRDDQSNDHPIDIVDIEKIRQDLNRAVDSGTWPEYIALDGAMAQRLWLSPIPDRTDACIIWSRVRKNWTGVSGTDVVDMWSRYLRWLIYELAKDLGDHFHIDVAERAWIASRAEKLRLACRLGKPSKDESAVIESAF